MTRAPVPTASVGAAVGPHLVGREAELGWLASLVDELAAGRGAAVLLEGEPGIGKSALLDAATVPAARSGCAVFRCAGEELGEAFPLLPLLDAFAIRESSADPVRGEVRQALRGLGVDAAAAAAEALLDLIDQLCARSPALLVVDELHWADAMTVSVCQRLARSAAQRPLLLIGAMRPLPRRDDLQALRDAVGLDGLLRLPPLAADAVGELVADLAGAAPGPALARLAADAAGNPLYLTELIDALDRGGGLAVSGGTAEVTSRQVPTTLAEAISDRLGFLPAPVRDVLQAAALLGGEFAVADLAVLTGTASAELAAPLADARAAGVLAEQGARLAFRHPLIRTALYDDLPFPVRAAWHRDAARALHNAGAGADQVARQLLPTMAEPADGLALVEPWMIDWLIQSAPALVGEASQVAVQLLRPVVEQLPAHDDRRHLLVGHLARALDHQARYDEVEGLIGSTLRHVSQPDVLVDLYDTLVRTRSATRTALDETRAELDKAMADLDLPAVARLHLQVLAVRLDRLGSENEKVEAVAREILAAATAADDQWAIGWMSLILAGQIWLRGASAEPLRLLSDAAATISGNPAWSTFACCCCSTGACWKSTWTASSKAADRSRKVAGWPSAPESWGEQFSSSGR